MDRSPVRASGCPAGGDAGPHVGDTAERAYEADHVIRQAPRARRVLDSTASTNLADRTTVGVEQSLEDGEPHGVFIDDVRVGDELRVRAGASEAELTEDRSHRIRNYHPAAAASGVPQHVIRPAFVFHLDPGQQVLERLNELRICCGEARRRRSRHTSIAEKQSESVGIHRHVASRRHGRAREHRKLVTMLVGSSQIADHLVGP